MTNEDRASLLARIEAEREAPYPLPSGMFGLIQVIGEDGDAVRRARWDLLRERNAVEIAGRSTPDGMAELRRQPAFARLITAAERHVATANDRVPIWSPIRLSSTARNPPKYWRNCLEGIQAGMPALGFHPDLFQAT